MSEPLAPDIRLLLRGLGAPLQLDVSVWERILRQARVVGLHARLAEANGNNPGLAEPIRRHLLSAARIAAYHRQMLDAELHRLAPLCRGDFPVVVLKGGAYALQQYGMAKGRLVSDVDLLVPREHLRTMEDRLRVAGWQAQSLDPYDERYYRDWSHEIPPLRYPGSLLEVDLHHAITPVTGGLQFDPGPLFDCCEPIAGTPFSVLGAEDQVLHAAVHCFHDGDLELRLREVADIDGLLRAFCERPDFWQRLIARADRLGLQTPLWYGLRYAEKWLDCPVPPGVTSVLKPPPRLAQRTMDTLVPLAMLPSDPDSPAPFRVSLARSLMRVRYHLLRMPPHLLAPHLLRKSWRRLQARLLRRPQSASA